jgi:hypothetical protein
MEGYIKLYRKITDNEYYLNERFDKTHAWIDLLILATYLPRKINLKGVDFNLEAGELCYSQKNLAKRWCWNRKSVIRFIEGLKKRRMVTIKTNRITSVITILNWNKYQAGGQPDGQLLSPIVHTNKNIKNKEYSDEYEKLLKEQFERD